MDARHRRRRPGRLRHRTLLAERGEQVRVITRSGRGPGAPASSWSPPTRRRGPADRADQGRGGHLQLRQPALPPLAHRLAADRGGAAARRRGQRRACSSRSATSTATARSTARSPRPPRSPRRTRSCACGREMWQDALAAHEAGRVRVTEARASDFVGSRAPTACSATWCCSGPRMARAPTSSATPTRRTAGPMWTTSPRPWSPSPATSAPGARPGSCRRPRRVGPAGGRRANELVGAAGAEADAACPTGCCGRWACSRR